ncbi:MAG: geranylgeranylglycerol-phosphate geranylgeranyltransferase [Chitinophagia bacterium]|jgi:4-hydroxybenzoate polyprenyltransferase
MKTITRVRGFMQLVRYPNLLFILLTQVLFYFSIIVPVTGGDPKLSADNFILLVLASVAIAAAGYIINDYFDMDIDYVNKPERMVIGKIVSRRWAMLLHMLLSLVGLFLTAIVSMRLGSLWLLFLNFLSVFLLLLYSTTFKKQFIVGNIIISLLTAWVIMSLFVAELQWNDPEYTTVRYSTLSTLYKYTLVYAAFAFVVSLIREVVKDMEDQVGDRKYGCTTMPIKWGEVMTKNFIFIWVFLLIAFLISLTVYAFMNNWSWVAALFALLIFIQVIMIAAKIKKASQIQDYAIISRDLKLLMLSGILSMISYQL